MNGSLPKPSGTVKDLFANLKQEEAPKDRKIKYLHEYEEQAMEYINNMGVYKGISTGYPAINERLGSFLPGEVLTIGGDTGHGKSILAMNIAQNVYAATQKPVLFINLELTVEQAVQRFYEMSGETRDYKGIMVQTSNDVNYRDVDQLMSEAKEEGAVMVVIDHLHFFDDAINDNAAAAITRVMKKFKKSAVKHELPVIVLSHVTPQNRINSQGELEIVKPNLHSFKGSKSIEQISDMVGFVYRHQNDTSKIDFYLCKNRSRQLDGEPVELTQKDWRLIDYSWAQE